MDECGAVVNVELIASDSFGALECPLGTTDDEIDGVGLPEGAETEARSDQEFRAGLVDPEAGIGNGVPNRVREFFTGIGRDVLQNHSESLCRDLTGEIDFANGSAKYGAEAFNERLAAGDSVSFA